MYLRKTKIFKDGKGHIYWSLVESIRTAKGPRQRTVACLGELNESQQKKWKGVANQVDGKPIIRGLFDSEEDKRVEAVQIGKVRVERMRRFGDAWLALALWRKLGLDEFFAKQMERGRWTDHSFVLITIQRRQRRSRQRWRSGVRRSNDPCCRPSK